MFDRTMTGKAFNVSLTLWRSMKLKTFIDPVDISFDNFVFAIGASRNHFNESLKALSTAQRWFPDKNIIFYDLEHRNHLEREQIQTVTVSTTFCTSLSM